MPISDDWSIDYLAQEIRHIDGILSYDANAGTAPVEGDYIRGVTSGAVGRIIAGSDLGGVSATGTFTLTDVVGRFQDNEAIDVMSELPFDGVANSGFSVGDVLETQTGSVSPTPFGTVGAIDYNSDGSGTGTAYLYSEQLGFSNNDVLDIRDGQAGVADVFGSEVDNRALFGSATVNGTLTVPGTTNENNSVIIHFDGGSISIPEDARVADASTGAVGFAQRVVGAITEGSIVLVDSDTTGGAWTDNNTLNIEQVVFYNNQIAGQVFSEGDVIVGSVSGASGRVLAVIDDGDQTGKIILADQTGTFSAEASPSDLLQIDNRDGTFTTVAQVESSTAVLAAATLKLPNGVRDEQRVAQGGIYAPGSLNIVRSSNALYTLLQDTFDELLQMDDNEPVSAQVLDQAYTLINGWRIPYLSFRFLESGAWKTENNAEIITNYQSLGTIADIGDNGYYNDSSRPTPQPNLYVEQNKEVLSPSWIEGNVNVLIRVKTREDPRYVAPATPTLGQLINSGTVTWFAREYLRLYDHFSTTTIGGTAPIPLATADDDNNTTGQYEAAYISGSPSGSFVDGEEVLSGSGASLKVGVITADDGGATGTVAWVLKSGTNFANGDSIVGQVSGKEVTLNAVPTSLVAGYGTDIRTMVCERQFSGGSWSVATPIRGEILTQATSGATGYYIEIDDASIIYIEEISGTFTSTDTLTGGTSGAQYTPTATAVDETLLGDLDNGDGEQPYNAAVAANITGASAQPVLNVYEWTKYLTRSESTFTFKGKGTDTDPGDREGRIFRRLETTYAEVKAAPVGDFAGSAMRFARAWWIEKSTLDAADIQNFRLIDANGTTRTPPNLQALIITNAESGLTAAAFRTTGALSTTILTTEFAVGTVGSPETDQNGSGSDTIVLAAGTRSVSPLPADVPSTGVLVIEDPANPGIFLQFPYSAVDRANNSFTLTSGTIGDVTGGLDLVAGDDAFVALILEVAAGSSVSNTIQYVSDIPLLIRGRKKGIIPFETTATFGSTGASVGLVKQTDTIVNLP